MGKGLNIWQPMFMKKGGKGKSTDMTCWDLKKTLGSSFHGPCFGQFRVGTAFLGLAGLAATCFPSHKLFSLCVTWICELELLELIVN